MFGSKLEVKRFEDRIVKYEQQPIETGRILLYGHSMFTRCQPNNKWGNPNIEEHVLMKDGSKAILNHGFGTSSADDLLYYYHRMVLPYKPRVLALWTASNDIAYGYNAYDIMQILARVIDWARADFPDIPIYCFCGGYSPKHKGKETNFHRINREYKEYLEVYCQKKGCHFVDMSKAPFYFDDPADMGDRDKIRLDIFDEDDTHLNAVGYHLFFDYIREILDEHL